MSRPLKLAQSGLGVARRGWSIPSASREPRSSQSIYDWSLTPPDPAARKLTGSEQGLKDIQGALSGYAPVPPSRFTSQVQNNRASPSGKTPPAIPARQFPTDWHSRPSLTRQPVGATNKETIYETSTSSSSVEKIASVSLSQEQTQILKLVQNGNSIFFTGSAGM
jgi:hypothetical protein